MRREAPIFIASSSEQKALAQKIASALSKKQFHPLPWWNPEVFRAGDITLDRLTQLAKLCEGAVLVFSGDDKIWSRGVTSLGVRDNVLLEYGLFLGMADREHTVIVAEQKAKRPTDLEGLTVIYFDTKKGSQAAAIEQVVSHFERLLLQENREFQSKPSILLHADWSTPLSAANPGNDPHYHLASLYSGLESAQAWYQVEFDKSYSARVQTSEGGAQVGELVGDRAVSTVVSLGPGAGSVDVEVMAHLHEQRWREYIPVDVNQYLLLESARRVAQQNAMTECVRGILCDFDTNLAFVGDVVKRHTKGPRLFLMIGGTFGNSAQTETALLRRLHSIMEDEDLFVFDLFCLTASYTMAQDPLFDLDKVPPSVQTFFATGLKILAGDSSLTHQEALQRIEVREATGSSLSGTRGIELIDRKAGSMLVRIRRFMLGDIVGALTEAGFNVVSPKRFSTGMLERHIVLASK